MRSLRYSGQYKKDHRACVKRGWRMAKLKAIVEKLQNGEPLRAIDDDHPLKGPWQDYRGCHIQGDWCLIYRVTADELQLVRTGTHTELFD